MNFGIPIDFAIEAYHEPSGPEWGGFGRMSIDIQGVRLGNIRDNHCSLFNAVDRFRTLLPVMNILWDEAFTGLSDPEIFSLLNHEIYLAEKSDLDRYGRFDFLTNTGEMFDDAKTFIACRPNGQVHILYQQFRGDMLGSGSCSVQSFRSVAGSFVRWFDE